MEIKNNLNNLAQKIKFYTSYWIFWLGYFIASRVVFLIYNWDKTISVAPNSEIFTAFWYGGKLDLSITGYLMLIPTLLLIISSFFKKNIVRKTIFIYTCVMLFILSFFVILDASLYGHWGNKLDFYGAVYLNNFGEVLNFIPIKTLLINTVAFFSLIGSFYFVYKKNIHSQLVNHQKDYWLSPIVFFLCIGLSIIPIRGGIGLNPINLSNVYFSNNTFSNHSAINVIWNVIYTFTEKEKLHQRFQYASTEKIEPYFHNLYPPEEQVPSVFKNQKPNIILIILESFTSSLLDRKWNDAEITPNLNQLKNQGIYFENFYASGDRTDEGLVSILSGFPAQPISYIINYQNKTAQLPSLIQDLKKENYHTAFYYGGDINFANMKSFLLQIGTETIIDKSDFSSEKYNAKWGVHDHFLFEEVLQEIKNSEPPFFKGILSLTSHPPFDTPYPVSIEGTDDGSLFANSANYTDQVLGEFISQFKQSKKWDNSIVIIVADHGAPYLDNNSFSDPKKYKVPMIWLGGALDSIPKVISKYASQTDIAQTLLSQLQIENTNYSYSKNIFSPSSISFSFYTFNHGFGFLGDSTQHIYNYKSKKFYQLKSNEFPDSIGNVYLQKISNDFSKN